MNKMTYQNPYVTADIIALSCEADLDDAKFLAVRRGREPYKGMCALPGGFLEVGKETVKQAAQREFREETGLIVLLDDLELVGESSNPRRDPRGHIVSLHYFARKYSGQEKAGDDADEIAWLSLNNPPQLAFDHNQIIEHFKNWIRRYGGKNGI